MDLMLKTRAENYSELSRRQRESNVSKRPEVRRKISESNKGRIPWNKGLTKEICPSLKSKLNKQIAKICPICYKEFKVSPSKKKAIFCSSICHGKTLIGKSFSEETRKKLSISRKGKMPKNFNREFQEKGHIACRGKSAWNKGKPMRTESKLKLSNSHKKRFELNPELIKKCLVRRDKSSLELKFEDIIKQLSLPYKFVGNGEVIVVRKCPDFINTNGEKIAVEVYYRKHKEKFRNGLEQWKAERMKIFNENGWELVFFDETQVKPEIVMSRLGGN